MMTAIFAVMLIALILECSGHGNLAVSCLLLSLILSVALFLWEIYSPVYGFRMPWLQVETESCIALVRLA
jgi:hypothetical protein